MRRAFLVCCGTSLLACTTGPAPEPGLATEASGLLSAPFQVGDPAQGPSPHSELKPSVVAGKGDFGALWEEEGVGLAFARVRVQQGKLAMVAHTLPVPVSEPISLYSYTGDLLFDGENYQVLHHKYDSRYVAELITLDAQGNAQDRRELPTWSYAAACSPSGVCLFAGDDGHTVNYALLPRGGELSAPFSPAPESFGGRGNLKVLWYGTSFAVLSSAEYSGSPAHYEIWLSRIDEQGQILGNPERLATSNGSLGVDEMDAAARGDDLLVAASTSSGLALVLRDGEGALSTHTFDDSAVRVAAPLSVRSVGDGFLVGYLGSHGSRYADAHVLRVLADGSPDPAGSHELTSKTVGEMIGPALASDGTHVLALAQGYAAYQNGSPPYLTSTSTPVSIHAQMLDAEGNGRDDLIRLVTADVTQFGPSLAFDGSRYVAAWLDNREGWEKLTLRGAQVTGSQARPLALAPGTESAGLVSVAVAARTDRRLTVWHEQAYDPERWSSLAAVKAQVTTADSAGEVLTLASELHDVRGVAAAANESGYLVTWYDDASQRLMAQAFTSDGLLEGEPFSVFQAGMHRTSARVALAPFGNDYLAAWVHTSLANSSLGELGLARIRNGKVTPIETPYAPFDVRSVDLACGTPGCMLVADDSDDGIFVLRLDGQAKPSAKWTRTPGDTLDMPRVAFTGSSFLLTAVDAGWPSILSTSVSSFEGAYILEYGLDGSVDADFTRLDIDNEGPVEIASDGRGDALLIYPNGTTGRIEGLHVSEGEVEGPSDDAGSEPSGDTNDGGVQDPDVPHQGEQDAGEREDSGAPFPPSAMPTGGDASAPEQGARAKSGCQVQQAGAAGALSSLSMLAALVALARRRRAHL